MTRGVVSRPWPIAAASSTLVALLFVSQALAGAFAQTLPGAGADTAAEQPAARLDDLSPEEARDAVARLSDAEVRELLLQQLEKGAEPTPSQGEGEFLDRLENGTERVRESLDAMFRAVDQVPEIPGLIWGQVTAGGTVGGLSILMGFALILVVGVVVERVFRRGCTGVAPQTVQGQTQSLRSRLGPLAMRALTDLLAVAVFALSAFLLLLLLEPATEAAEWLFMAVLGGVVAWRLLTLASRTALCPRAPWLRLIPINDAAARTMHSRIALLVSVFVFNRTLHEVLDGYSLPWELVEIVGLFTSFVFVLVIIGVIWDARAPVAALIAGGSAPERSDSGGLPAGLARTWHVLATAYVLGVWVLAIGVRLATGVDTYPAGLASLLILVAVPVADDGLRRLVTRFFGPAPEQDGETSPTADAAAQGEDAGGKRQAYARVTLRNLRIILWLLVVALFVQLWSIDVEGLAQQLLGPRVARALFNLGITALLAYAVWGIVKTAVEHQVGSGEAQAQSGGGPGEEAGGAGVTRAQTLLPVFRKFMLATLVVIGIMIGLSSLGVNIGPLLAGAGVVGIAIGFGAQALVRDIVSGIFFLMDDAFRLGEYIEIDQIRGTVEKISIRSLRLRHHTGLVHTVPFGEIRHLTNWSRDWALMRFEIRVPFETDLEKVRKIIKKVGQEMMDDPEIAPLMLAPLKSQGVNTMDDSALIVRCKFMTLPGEQFYVRRQAYNRIQKAFEEQGLKFAPRRVLVEASSPGAAGSAAAAGALDTEAEAARKSAKADPNAEPG